MKNANAAGQPAKQGDILQENSTHKAVLNGDLIDIIMKGIHLEETFPGADDGIHYEDELLYSIRADQQDDLFSIFENLDEENRCNVAEANAAFNDMTPDQLEKLFAWANEEKIPAPGQEPPVITAEHELINATDPDVLAARGELAAAEMDDANIIYQENHGDSADHFEALDNKLYHQNKNS